MVFAPTIVGLMKLTRVNRASQPRGGRREGQYYTGCVAGTVLGEFGTHKNNISLTWAEAFWSALHVFVDIMTEQPLLIAVMRIRNSQSGGGISVHDIKSRS